MSYHPWYPFKQRLKDTFWVCALLFPLEENPTGRQPLCIWGLWIYPPVGWVGDTEPVFHFSVSNLASHTYDSRCIEPRTCPLCQIFVIWDLDSTHWGRLHSWIHRSVQGITRKGRVRRERMGAGGLVFTIDSEWHSQSTTKCKHGFCEISWTDTSRNNVEKDPENHKQCGEGCLLFVTRLPTPSKDTDGP